MNELTFTVSEFHTILINLLPIFEPKSDIPSKLVEEKIQERIKVDLNSAKQLCYFSG